MRFSPTLASIVIAGTVFILTPYVPTWLLNPVVGTKIGSALLLIAVLAVMQYDIVISLGVALAVAALFLEHRRRTIKSVQAIAGVEMPKKLPMKSSSDLISKGLYPVNEVENYEVEARPEEDTYEAFHSDQKVPLDTVDGRNSVVIKMLEKAGVV